MILREYTRNSTGIQFDPRTKIILLILCVISATIAPSLLYESVLVFAIATGALCYVAYRLTRFAGIGEQIETYEAWLVPLVFILLGIYILWENHTISWLWNLVF